jgi:hypothetical protein
VRWLFLAVGLFGQGAGFPHLDVSALAVAPPLRVTELGMKRLKGEPRRLS